MICFKVGIWGGRQSVLGTRCSALRKVEALRLLNVGVSDRTDRGAIRPCSGLNTIGENLRKRERKNAQNSRKNKNEWFFYRT